LNNFEKTKESELGIRITRHLKLLKRIASLSHVRKVWESIVKTPATEGISKAPELSAEVKFSFDQSQPTTKPARIYVLALALVLLIKEKKFIEVTTTITRLNLCPSNFLLR
jgi:hypothetical protein